MPAKKSKPVVFGLKACVNAAQTGTKSLSFFNESRDFIFLLSIIYLYTWMLMSVTVILSVCVNLSVLTFIATSPAIYIF